MTEPSGPHVTDEMRAVIGVESDSEEIQVDGTVIRRVAELLEDQNPLWNDAEAAKSTPYGGLVAFPIALHPSLHHAQPRVSYTSPFSGGSVLAGDEWEFIEPIRPGDRITVSMNIAGFEELPGRNRPMLMTTREYTYRNQHGRVAFIARRSFLSFAPKSEG